MLCEKKAIIDQILQKRKELIKAGYSREEDFALTTFFDLAQQSDDLESLINIARGVLKVFFNWDSEIHLYRPDKERFPADGPFAEKLNTLSDDYRHKPLKRNQIHIQGRSLFVPVTGNEHLRNPYGLPHHYLGSLEIKNGENLTAQEIMFLQKISDRIGCALHRRILAKQDSDHLQFINTLIADIEHNVIVPNMIFKLFLHRIRAKIKKNKHIEEVMKQSYDELENKENPAVERISKCLIEMEEVNRSLEEEYNNLEKHYKNTSLFLETLFRKSHFEAGTFVLKKRTCKFKQEVIDPQLERFLPRFKQKGIEIDNSLGGIPDIEIELVVDVGLISQVYANLFSNALKYTREIPDANSKTIKYIAFGWEKIPGYFTGDKDGIKFNVFSTGPHVDPDEHDKIFEDGYRGKNSVGEPGTGHGLSFVKKVVQIHGGVAGYEPTPHGNNFYFVLPIED